VHSFRNIGDTRAGRPGMVSLCILSALVYPTIGDWPAKRLREALFLSAGVPTCGPTPYVLQGRTLPGDLVQVDTLDRRPLPGVVLKRFGARGVIFRWDVLDVAARATAATADRFLDSLERVHCLDTQIRQP
jgi:hypothetical protein